MSLTTPPDEGPSASPDPIADWPIGTQDLEARAREHLDQARFDWIAGGAGEEWTLQENLTAFRRWKLVPKVLTGNADRDASVEILGTRSPAPFLLAPIGGLTVAHPDGDLAVGRACAEVGVPFVLSTAASFSMEEIVAEMDDTPRWFQLYWVSDKGVVESFAQRARSIGCRAIVLTVDTPEVGIRDRDFRNRYVPFVRGAGIGQYTSDPVFRSRLDVPPEVDMKAAGEAVVKMFPNFGVTWADLVWLRELIDIPLLMKGILSVDDARRCFDAGFDGVIVSNHGGRQLDGEMASIDALPAIRESLGPDATILMDGGVRRGTDVAKALALGADAVLLGRPYVYALALGGSSGVARLLANFIAECHHVLGLLGVSNPKGLTKEFAVRT